MFPATAEHLGSRLPGCTDSTRSTCERYIQMRLPSSPELHPALHPCSFSSICTVWHVSLAYPGRRRRLLALANEGLSLR